MKDLLISIIALGLLAMLLIIFLPVKGIVTRTQLSADHHWSATDGWFHLYTSIGCADDWFRPQSYLHLQEDIQNATESVLVASYALDEPLLVKSLRDVAETVDVHIHLEDGYSDERERVAQSLEKSGATVTGDSRSGLMHNKFVVIDGKVTWTGSTNFTREGATCNRNNLIRLQIPQIAENYTNEFWNLSNDWSNPVPNPQVRLNQTSSIYTYFSPNGNIQEDIINLISTADKHILVMGYSFTSEEIMQAIMQKHDEGVSVQIVLENSQAQSQYSVYEQVVESGIETRLDSRKGMMHHKVIIVDGTVVMGSYNFSNNAEKVNEENTLIITSPAVSAAYQDEFHRVWKKVK